MTSRGDRLLAGLPAVYQASDTSGELAGLLGVFETLLFDGEDDVPGGLPGIERRLQSIPALFAPLGEAERTPAPFLGWLASWLAFTPHALFDEAALRRIVAGIVPLYGLRGTRDYLEKLIVLCFDEVGSVHVDDRPRVGFTVGALVIGSDTRLAQGRAFWFKVVVELQPGLAHADRDGLAHLERRLRAVIDFAKPAHTTYELHVNQPRAADAPDWHEG